MSLTGSDLAAREALRVRQGDGARYDALNAPAEDLLLARRGAAYFARKLNELSDAELSESSQVTGWTRRHLIADISYRARAMAIALKGIRDGLGPEEAGWEPDVEHAATLPARALRHLYAHSDIHLNVEFRDLKSSDWDRSISWMGGVPTPIRDLPLMRAATVWFGAVDLGNGSTSAELPARILSMAPSRICEIS